jgi:hypothetical protein
MRPPVLLLLLLAAALAWPAAGGAKLVRNTAPPGAPAAETGGQKAPTGKGPRICTSPAARSVGAWGSLRMIRAVAGPAGVPCRAFVHTIHLGGRSHAAPWTACRHGGAWRLKP